VGDPSRLNGALPAKVHTAYRLQIVQISSGAGLCLSSRASRRPASP